MRDVGNAKPHFDAAQRAGQHQVVEVAKMANPEDPAGKTRQAVAERHVEMLENGGAEGIGIMAFRHHDSGQRTGIVARFLAQHLEAPGLNGAPGGLGMPVVTCEYTVETFLVKHVDGLGEAIEKVCRRGVGKGAAGIRGKLLLPVPIGAAKAVCFGFVYGAFGDGVEGQPGGQHQAFLRSRHGDVDTPLVMPEINRCQ